MGIKGLANLLADNCKHVLREKPVKDYFNRKVAVDASMAMYQFMIAVRGAGHGDLTSNDGKVTSHVIGMMYRTIKLLEAGVKPCYVFDGKPPEMKQEELKKRREKAESAEKKMEEAKETGNAEEQVRQHKRMVRVSKEQTEEVKRLLRLMGVPIVEAPGEAEAQCAAMQKAGLVWAAGSEDADTLTFGAGVLLRRLTFAESQKKPVLELQLQEILDGLELTMDQFIDLCILCGCDYCPTIRGVGPHTALKLIKEHGNIEKALEAVKDKYKVPDDFAYERARELFTKPDVNVDGLQLKWAAPDEEGLLKFLVGELQFQEDRLKKAIERLKATRTKTQQGRLDTFFKVMPKPAGTGKRVSPSAKAGGKAKGPAAKKARK